MAITMPTVLIEQAFAIAAEQLRRDEKVNREAGAPSVADQFGRMALQLEAACDYLTGDSGIYILAQAFECKMLTPGHGVHTHTIEKLAESLAKQNAWRAANEKKP